jgi:predicted nucleotidyltransferase
MQGISKRGLRIVNCTGSHGAQQCPDVTCPVHEELRGLIQKTLGIAGVLSRALLPLAHDIRLAFLFGSFAQGRQKAASDIDIMILGEASFQAVARTLLEPQR